MTESNLSNTNTNSINSTKFSFSSIPQSILESDIFVYLNSKDLFYSVRGVCSEWQELMKNIWTDNIKSEMIDQVKSLDFIYEKEIYTKTYENKLNYLINYKQLLCIYSTQANILAILATFTNRLNESNFMNFFKIYFGFVGLNEANDRIDKYENETNDEIKSSHICILNEFLTKDGNFLIFRNKIFELLDLEILVLDQTTVSQFKERLIQINREDFENSDEMIRLLFTFLNGLIEFQILKFEVKELRKKIENLIFRIKEETQVWPKRKNFFEKAYKLIIFSKCTNERIRDMINLFESHRIRHPLADFNDQALQMIYDLKSKLTNFYDSDNFCEENLDDFGAKSIDEIIFNNILARRVLLTQKILIVDKLSQIYANSKTENQNIFKIGENTRLNLKELLWCMKFSSNSENENVTEESLLKTKKYLDDHFDYENNIIYDCGRKSNKSNRTEYIDSELEVDLSELDKELEVTFDKSERSLSDTKKTKSLSISCDSNQNKYNRYTEEDLNRLKKEKEILEEQKTKTENVLEMLKKFVSLKQNLSNNKKKYKLALYLLSNIRQGDTSILSRIDEVDIEGIEFNDDMQISENEREELDNFKDSDKLMKEIEEGILIQIEKIMQKENEDNL